MHELPFTGRQSSKDNPMFRVRKSRPYVSNSARIFWKVMKEHHPLFFIWNCVPIHPYKNNNILSVRTPSTQEVMRFSRFLLRIVSLLKPTRVVALGRKAEFSLIQLSVPCTYVRHPSQAGANRFIKGMARIVP
jgi:uracil-DNA glycosylase